MRNLFSLPLLRSFSSSIALLLPLSSLALGQEKPSEVPPQPGEVQQAPSDPGAPEGHEAKRIFGIVPNYRTSPSLQNYEPLTAKQKYKLFTQDAFDRGTFVLAAAFAGESQLSNANPSFGQGAAGYGQYLGTSYADFVIGDFMTEALFPSLLHQDPRYFRKGTGSSLSRLGYACGQIFMTHNDSGRTAVNYSELLGNSAAVAISNSYYADNRDARDAGVKLASQLGVDMAANVLKEFWPEINHKFSRHRKPSE